MNRNKLKTYAPQARREFIKAVTDRAAFYGLTADKIEPVAEQGDVAVIGGKAFPKSVAANRKLLEQRIARQGFEQVVEAMAYTWFNRFVAIRYMELHGYLDHGYRVLSVASGQSSVGRGHSSAAGNATTDRGQLTTDNTPEILRYAEHVQLPGLDREEVIELKLEGNKEAELYDRLLLAQCHALHKAMPFLFEPIDDETELLLPDNLLHSDSLIRKLVAEIPADDWQEVEIIGWLYQFYISEKKDQVIGKVVKSEDIPAATQLFTPNWIVKYLVQNSLGRQWMATYPDSPLKSQMEYYIEPAEQTPEVQEQLKAITPTELNPEELTLLDPACGSGHILVEAYDLLKAIYQERGYRAKDIPRLILEKNLFGLEIDDRAAQLAAFALMMKARADDRRIFEADVQPNVLAIQESKGLDAKEITEALNQPIFKGELPPPESLFEEIDDDKTPLFSRKNLSEPGHISLADVAQLIELFEHGKTFGSLIQVPEKLIKELPAIAQRVEAVTKYGGMLEKTDAKTMKPLIAQARLLARQYDAVVTNPPYMGSKYYDSVLKTHVAQHYKEAKGDLCTCLVDRCFQFSSPEGVIALITMHNWMFLWSFEDFRQSLLGTHTVLCMAHLGPFAFPQISGQVVQVTAFAASPFLVRHYRGSYRRLLDGTSDEKARTLHLVANYSPSNEEFNQIPGSPIAYWASPSVYRAFSGKKVAEVVTSEGYVLTGNNAKYIRFHWEVDAALVGGQSEWRQHPRGGDCRRWYGNVNEVVDWSEDARTHYRKDPVGRVLDCRFWDLEGICWSEITVSKPSFRQLLPHEIANKKSPAVYAKDGTDMLYLLAFLNSAVAVYLLSILNPTMGFGPGDILRLPLVMTEKLKIAVRSVSECCIPLARNDWDSHETSWDFAAIPVIQCKAATLKKSQETADERQLAQMSKMKELEEENNRLFIEAYGLQHELSSPVLEDQITLYRPDREEDIQRLISYAIGCMMGRYSLDEPGLIYAHSGNQGFDPSRYKTFAADQDGIIPITDTDWFPDDAANRFVQFIATAWPKEHLEENLKFVAESLGPKKDESPRDTIRRYLSQGFFKHHLSMYKRRPIYWLFSSGKQGAFECLVYLHRYNEGTLSRMRTEYVIPLQGKIDARIEQLREDIASATSTAHGKRLQKERDKLIKQQAELRKFDEKLRHYADLRISLDLDDGVKVNYGKFGDLLAEVKAVTGGN